MNAELESVRRSSPNRDVWRRWCIPLAIAALALALGFGGEAARVWGRYEREALELGELWRLATAHLVHLGWGHLVMNVTALLLLGALFDELLEPLEWLGAAVVSAAAIDAGLYLLEHDVGWYVGLSGVLHGLLAFGALRLLPKRRAFAAVLLAVLGGKLVLEQTVGVLPWSSLGTGGPVIVAAHLYGAAGGVLAVGAAVLLRRVRNRPV